MKQCISFKYLFYILVILITSIIYSGNAYANTLYTYGEDGGCVKVDSNTRNIDGVLMFTYPFYERADKSVEWIKQSIASITVTFKNGNTKTGTGTMIGQDSMLTSSLLIYDDAKTSSGFTYPVLGDIDKIEVNMVADNKKYSYILDNSDIFTSDIANSQIKNIDASNLKSDFTYDLELLSECYMILKLDDCIGIRTGFCPLSDFTFDHNKYIQTYNHKDGSLIEDEVIHTEKRESGCIIYNKSVDNADSIGAPAFSIHNTSDGKGVGGYITAGINQGTHNGLNVITTFYNKRDLFLNEGFFTYIPYDFKYTDIVERFKNEKPIYGTKGYNPTGKDLVLEGSFNYIDNSMKKDYPFSPICIIAVTFQRPDGNTETYASTGQLIDKGKILTCGHAFTFNQEELENDLRNSINNKRNISDSSWGILKTRDELFEKELEKYNKIIGMTEAERQQKIDELLTEYDLAVLDTMGRRPNSNYASEYRQRIAEKNSRNSNSHQAIFWVTEEGKEEALENERKAIEKVDLQIQQNSTFKLAWEFPEFLRVQVDFMYNTDNQESSTDHKYNIDNEDIIIHPDYDLVSVENDLAIIRTTSDLGDKYGWLGLTTELENNKLYSLTGYPTEYINGSYDTMLKNLYLTSNTTIINTNIGEAGESLYWYDLATAKGFSGSSLKVKSENDTDYRVVSIHYGKYNEDNGYPVGNKITKEIIEWVQSIDSINNKFSTEGYNPTGNDLVLEGSFNYIDNTMKKEYPFSPICTVEPVFVTKKGNLGSYMSTGQLVDKSKVLTCAHAFTFDAIELERSLDEYDKNSNGRSQQTFRMSRDSLYEKELAKIERIEKYKKDNNVEEIVFEPDILRVERPYTIEEEYELRKKATKSNVERTQEEEKAFREKLRQSKHMLRDDLYEKELDKIERIRKEEERRKDLTLDEKFAWEFDNFYGVYIDFGYDTENDTEGTNDIYEIPKENIIIHKDYLFETEENDLSYLTTQEDLGDTYGYFGLTSEIRDKVLYSLTGYPDELIDGNLKTTLKNMYLTSSTGNINRNLGDYNNYLYYYDIVTAKGFSGSGLKVKSENGNDYKIASIHYGKNSETGYPVGNKMTKEVIEWIQGIS